MDQLPPIVMVHGAWHGKWCYEEYFCDYFQNAGLEAYAIDLPKHGNHFNNTSDLRWLSISDYVEAVAEFTGKFERPPIIVGHSMGGFVTQKYLEKHRAAGGVLLASVPPTGVFPLTLRMLRREPTRFLRANLTLSLYPLIETKELAAGHFFSAENPPEQLDAYFNNLHDESYRAYLDMLRPRFIKPKRVSQPVLVLGGETDTIFTVNEIRQTARAYNTQAYIFPQMAHDMMLESNWQAVADKIIDWIRLVFTP